MENLVFYQGVAVGIDNGVFISWFPSASNEAISALAGSINTTK